MIFSKSMPWRAENKMASWHVTDTALLNDLTEKVSAYTPNLDKERLAAAYNYAKNKHDGQHNKRGDA